MEEGEIMKTIKIKSDIKDINKKFILGINNSIYDKFFKIRPCKISYNMKLYKLSYDFIDDQYFDSDSYISKVKYKYKYNKFDDLLSKLGEMIVIDGTLKNSSIIFDTSMGYHIVNIKIVINDKKYKFKNLDEVIDFFKIKGVESTEYKNIKNAKLKIKVIDIDDIVLNKFEYKFNRKKDKNVSELISMILFKSVISSLDTGPYDIKIKTKILKLN